MPALDVSQLTLLPGRPFPPGTVVRDAGIRFALVSRHARKVWLSLFNAPEDEYPAVEYAFDPRQHRFGDVWSVFVTGLRPGALYMFRCDGPREPEKGHRFDPNRYLFDPCAKAIVGDLDAQRAKCMVVHETLNWFDDERPCVPISETVIYEAHLRGFTAHTSSGVSQPGTYRALIEKIPYLKEFGVTSVELLPLQECGEVTLKRRNPETNQPLHNYWGYHPLAWFAPSARFVSDQTPGAQIEEFREMVVALHRAGMELILDVVFNHTVEGNERGPALSFRGIDNSLYYLLDPKGGYRDFSGCGNTVCCGHPVVADLIVDCLRYWVNTFHVDGFRVDLASVLSRDRKGHLISNAPLIERITEDPLMRGVKLIAEAWDVGGGYQVGSFGGERWAEWNDRYRDDVRKFWRGDAGAKSAFALRITGSPDLYQWGGRGPANTINLIACHDGFTLRDLVSYNEKHNEANGEENRDGLNENYSWNCGVEGETKDRTVLSLRLRMQKNYLTTLFLSLGVPMLLGGDEFGRTQRGNNNAYCQDNEISWFDWTLLETNRDLHRFCQEVICFRKANPVFARMTYFTGQPTEAGKKPDLLWFDAAGASQTWLASDLALACWINGSENNGVALYLLFNPMMTPLRFMIPPDTWRVRINTSLNAPRDIPPLDQCTVVIQDTPLSLAAKSMMVLSSVSTKG
ncbi:MAG: glycogen-debranching protein [Candidatus Hydrogenedentes bacterium]|nr:glycogen-debranching protein [Candidatus Hydrogenedentota bacterium]